MAAELTIRRARREDLPELVQFYRHLVPDDVPVSTERAEEIWERFGIFLGLVDGRHRFRDAKAAAKRELSRETRSDPAHPSLSCRTSPPQGGEIRRHIDFRQSPALHEVL